MILTSEGAPIAFPTFKWVNSSEVLPLFCGQEGGGPLVMQKFPLSEPDLLHFPYLSITFWWANQGKQMHIMNVSKIFWWLVSVWEVKKIKLMIVHQKCIKVHQRQRFWDCRRAYQVYMLRALGYKQMRPKQHYMIVICHLKNRKILLS